jgi:hypothetical protein
MLEALNAGTGFGWNLWKSADSWHWEMQLGDGVVDGVADGIGSSQEMHTK